MATVRIIPTPASAGYPSLGRRPMLRVDSERVSRSRRATKGSRSRRAAIKASATAGVAIDPADAVRRQEVSNLVETRLEALALHGGEIGSGERKLELLDG